LWRDDRSLELMDSTIGCPSSTFIILRFINIGLLCVQESPADRPTMPDLLSFISNELSPLPTPKQPAFATIYNMMDTNSTTAREGSCTLNNITISTMEAR
jgi:hypothetical protein